MRPGRRAFLLGAGASLAAAAGGRALAQASDSPKPLGPRGGDEPVAVQVSGSPLDHFSLRDRERRDFGGLVFRSGVELRSPYDGFGGFSGLWRSGDGEEIIAITDAGQWLTARVATRDGRLTGLDGAEMHPILGQDGRPLRRGRSYDTEALTIAGGVAYIGVERVHEVRRLDLARGGGMKARGVPVPLPPEARRLPGNRSLEAIGVAPPRHPLAGAVVAIAERARRGEANEPTRGFILGGPRPGAFDVARSDEFEITDLAFLPSGDMLLLERRFSLLRGVGCRIRRIPPPGIAPGALADGPAILEADGGHQIDNMEGIALHRDPSGATIVTLISDDNFSVLQRTLLLEFALKEG